MKRVLSVLVCVIVPLLAGTVSRTATFDSRGLSFTTAGGYDVVELSGYPALVNPGMPRVPRVVERVLIPAGAEPVSAELTAVEWTTMPGRHNLAPAQPDVPLPMPGKTFNLPHYAPDAAVYSTNAFYPTSGIRLLDAGTLGGYRIVGVELLPVRFNPVTGELQLATRMEYRLAYAEGTVDGLVPSAEQQAFYAGMVRGMVANPGDVARFAPAVGKSALTTLPAGHYEYVVISAPPIDTCFARLVAWKNLKGVPATTVLLSYITTNYAGYDTPEKIRNFIKDAYTNWGTKYVLLGGAADHKTSGQNIIPGRDAWYVRSGENAYNDEDTIPCDLYFGGLDGTWDATGNHVYGQKTDAADMLSEVFVGRASVNNVAQARNFVNKTLTYEQNPPAGYIKKMLLPAAILWDAYNERPMQDSIARMTPAGWTDAKLYERTSTLSETRMVDSMNSGYGLGNWIGHGNETGIYMSSNAYLSSSDADGLTNGTKEGIHVSIACFTGAWDEVSGGDCFAEHLVNRVGGGAVGIAMNSRYGWGAYTTQYVPGPSDRLDTTFLSRILNHTEYHAGQALAFARGYWAPWADSTGQYDMQRWCIYELNLFGDPELSIWTAEPTLVSAAHSGTIAVGNNLSYPVTVTTALASPVESATVLLWKGSEVYVTGKTNSSGAVTLTVSPQTAGNMTLTVTSRNHYMLVDTVVVTGGTVHDVGCTRLLAPVDTLDSGAVVTPACSVYNYGAEAETYSVRMRIGAYDQTAQVTAQAVGAATYVTFPSWTATGRGAVAVRCSTELATDIVPANDRQQGSAFLAVRDAGVTRIVAPAGTIDTSTEVTPTAVVRNFGTAQATFAVRMTIGDFYTHDTSVTIAGVTTDTVRFATWTVEEPGMHAVRCSTMLAGDQVPANDAASDSVYVPATGVDDAAGTLPAVFALGRCLPSPSNGRVTVGYALPEPSEVMVQVFDVSGGLVRTLVSGTRPAGRFVAAWDGRDVAGRRAGSGVYYCRMTAGAFQATSKVTVQR